MAFQFDLVGEPEGAFYEPYEYYDRDVRFISSADTLLKIANGKMDPVVAFTVGKLKAEGDLTTALKLGQLARG